MIFPAIVIRTRRFVFDEMSNEYVRFYQACGLSNSKIFYKYIFRVAGVKIIRDIPLDLIIALFGASILTENQWGIPGMGKYINDAFSDNKKDIYFVMGYATLVATFTIFSKIIADIIAALLDKRLVLK
jgi:oligopeptide transport system permease protein